MIYRFLSFFFFFFNDTATTEIYTLSLHDALPIYEFRNMMKVFIFVIEGLIIKYHKEAISTNHAKRADEALVNRSEEHTSELQSRLHLVCRLLLEKKKKKKK